jgi:hypothetical protein
MADGRGPDANKLAFFKYMKSHFGGRLAELIYTPGGAGIKDGRPFTYGGQVAATTTTMSTSRSTRAGRVSATGSAGGGSPRPASTSRAPARYGIAVDPSVIPLGSQREGQPEPVRLRRVLRGVRHGRRDQGPPHRLLRLARRSRAQNAWGSRTVTISTGGWWQGAARSPSGGSHKASRPKITVGTGKGGGGGLPGGAAGPTPRRTSPTSGSRRRPRRAQDNLPKLIAALTAELTQKRRRKKLVTRWLKRHKRMKPDRPSGAHRRTDAARHRHRGPRALLKEYRADARAGRRRSAPRRVDGGGRTGRLASRAGRHASVDADPEAGPTPMDFANAADRRGEPHARPRR